MEKMCHNCQYCKPRIEDLGYTPFYDGHCSISGVRVNYNDFYVCDSHVLCEAKCKDCRYCEFEESSIRPGQLNGYCYLRQFARTPDAEYIDDDTIGCCEFVKKENN